jgi:hypothetical protein
MPRKRLLPLARPKCALSSLVALCLAACSSGDPAGTDLGPGHGDGGPDDDTDGGGDGVPEALFILQPAHRAGAGWPQDFTGYSLLVCNPSFTAADLASIRADLPGAVLLAYTNIHDIPIGLHPGNPYFEALEAAFDSSLCVTDLATGNVVRVYGYAGTPGSGYPHCVLRVASAEILVAFHRDVTMAAGWDGFYVDCCNLLYPDWRRATLLSQTTTFDCDGDGVADTIEKLENQYASNRPYFTRRLRQELGPDVILVGNSGGALADINLNGITLEGVGDRFTVEEARTYFAQQEAVSRDPFTAVLWATTDLSRGPSRALAGEIPGACYGVVDDG